MKRALLTGGTGFVGANLTRSLLREGHDVHLLVRHDHHPWRIEDILDEVNLHVAVLADIDSVRAVVDRVRAEWVFHLAAYGAYPNQRDLERMVSTNIVGTMNLLEAARGSGFEAFINTGSSSEYGFKDHAPAEDETLEPNSHYAVTKAAATMFCMYTARTHDLHVPTLRLYSAYGPYEEPSRLMPTIIMHGLDGKLPPLADPAIARDYVYSEDICDAFLAAARRTDVERGGVYNVGTGIQTTLRDVVHLARETLHIEAEPEWDSMPARSWDTAVWVSDISKIRREIGWSPRFDLKTGFRAFVDWLEQHRTDSRYALTGS